MFFSFLILCVIRVYVLVSMWGFDVCMCICICVYEFMDACMYICAYECVYVFMDGVCIDVHV